MKQKLLHQKINKLSMALFLSCFCLTIGFSQTNLVLNGTADDFTVEADDASAGLIKNINDNADAFDMTPSSTVISNSGTTENSPYRAIWNNTALDAWLDSNCGDDSELPGASSDGNYVNGVKTRGLKINETCRRLYQVITVNQGIEHTFSIESRSEVMNVPSEVFLLNTEISDEIGLSATSSTVDAYMNITNDFNVDKSSATENNFTTTTFTVTPTSTKLVIYIRATAAVDSSSEVFYDNISLIQTGTPPPPSNDNLILNGTGDELTVEADDASAGLLKNVNDNADAFDMTPSSTFISNTGATENSPYRAIWNNTALDAWLDTNCGDDSELPAATSDGNYVNGVKTRGFKLNEACRRLYQVVDVTQGSEYIFSMESRSEAQNVPSEVFILNTEISDETGLSATSTTVDAYSNITNDFNADKSSATENNFTTTTFNFTASSNKVIIYVRAPLAVDGNTEVFYDNFELRNAATASVDTNFLDNLKVYPNPTNGIVKISSSENIKSLEVFNTIGKKVLSVNSVKNNTVDVSSLTSGLYFIKLTDGINTATKRLIKN